MISEENHLYGTSMDLSCITLPSYGVWHIKENKPSVSVELQVKEAVLVRNRSLSPLMSVVHQVCVVGQSLIVPDVFVQRVAIVT